MRSGAIAAVTGQGYGRLLKNTESITP
jgi:hypothetical protein